MCNSRIQRDFRGRRGAGIEMAMILMLVVVAFSALLTSTVVLQTQKVKTSTERLELLQQRTVLDQIGRDFCEQQDLPSIPDGYTYAAVVDGLTLTVKENESGPVVLTVVLSANEGGTTYTVTQWSYGN